MAGGAGGTHNRRVRPAARRGDDAEHHRHVDDHNGHDDDDLEWDVGRPEHERRDLMSRKKRMQNLREAKDKRMKKIALGGAVLLVAVLAFEVPKMLHSSGSSTSSPPPATTTTTAPGASTTPVATTTPTGTPVAAAAPTAASTKLPDSDTNPAVGKAKLYSFSHFTGKDPFVQQVNAAAASAGSASASTAAGSSESSKPPASGTTTAAISHKPTRTLAANGAARISINGRVQVVRVGTSFPSGNPLFRLVSVAGGAVRIGIAAGSYTSGAKTVSLAAGRSLTLVDTADGIRYSIRLLSAA